MNKIYNNLSIDNLMQTDWGVRFTERQKEQIKIGLEKGLDVSKYAKSKFSVEQMEKI